MDRLTSGEGEALLTGEVKVLGPDMVVCIYGGTHPHVGAVSIGVPRPSLEDEDITSATVSTYTVLGHKDNELSYYAAYNLAARLERKVVVTAGFHIDNAGKEQVNAVLDNNKNLVEKIIRQMRC